MCTAQHCATAALEVQLKSCKGVKLTKGCDALPPNHKAEIAKKNNADTHPFQNY